MAKARHLGAALGLALAGLLVAVSPAAATQRSSGYPSNPVYGCNGGLCTNAWFTSVWQVSQERDAGITYYVVSKLEMAAVLSNAKTAAAQLGLDLKQIGWNAKFLDSSGNVLATLYPGLGVSCYSSLTGQDSLLFKACRVSDYRVPGGLSASKVRFNFLVIDTTKNGLGWGASWTTSIS